MIVGAITGGVACGKSFVAEKLRTELDAPFLSCDAIVAELLREDDVQERVLALLAEVTGLQVSSFEKSLIRKHAFENSEFREKLESLIHPLVYDRVVDFLGDKSGCSGYIFVEVPLLYEVVFPLKRDFDLVVASSAATQVQRLTKYRGLAPEIAKQILEAQLPIEEKIRRADIVVWNDGSLDALNAQIDHLVRRCFSYN